MGLSLLVGDPSWSLIPGTEPSRRSRHLPVRLLLDIVLGLGRQSLSARGGRRQHVVDGGIRTGRLGQRHLRFVVGAAIGVAPQSRAVYPVLGAVEPHTL